MNILNNAVHLLDDFLSKTKPAYEGYHHSQRRSCYRVLNNQQLLSEMAAAVERGKKHYKENGCPDR